jgi:hypothetical protein
MADMLRSWLPLWGRKPHPIVSRLPNDGTTSLQSPSWKDLEPGKKRIAVIFAAVLTIAGACVVLASLPGVSTRIASPGWSGRSCCRPFLKPEPGDWPSCWCRASCSRARRWGGGLSETARRAPLGENRELAVGLMLGRSGRKRRRHRGGTAVGLCSRRPDERRGRSGPSPCVSGKVLTETLRDLERDGLVSRSVYAEVPPRVEYELTELGRTLHAPLGALGQWA